MTLGVSRFLFVSETTTGKMIVYVCLALTVCVAQISAMALESSELKVIEANGVFTNNLYKEIAKEKGNVFFSPISAHAVLSMAYQGADGVTKDAFASTLKVPNEKVAAEGYSHIMNRLNNVQNVTLNIANKVYLMEKFALQDEFSKSVKDNFQSEVQQLNFAENTKSAGVINGWVEDKTNKKIKDLIKPDSLSSDTRLVLVNAIYFKGDWLNKFDAKNTKKQPFFLNEVDKVDVDMMFRKGDYRYKFDRDLDAQVLELPYANKALSMIVVLPNKKDGIRELEGKLVNTPLDKVIEGMYSTDVEVYLPKFKIETTIDLKEILTNMGLGNIFSNSANFSKMITGGEPLSVSEVIQKAFIEVNEEGSEAAAATGLIPVLELPTFPRQTPVFKADHPFVAYLLDAKFDNNHLGHKSELFRGRISKF
ncbi:antichymotrypsin-2 isoform X6 [Aethina tumida]|uniref:antichymotrypsin-2 isoform X6 n=1 Tax=Aethina tumida TaxID=116153 RepID=UPI00096B0559|nr:antichymotrypsin-2 isoform X6 [Aethina tumida]